MIVGEGGGAKPIRPFRCLEQVGALPDERPVAVENSAQQLMRGPPAEGASGVVGHECDRGEGTPIMPKALSVLSEPLEWPRLARGAFTRIFFSFGSPCGASPASLGVGPCQDAVFFL